MQKKVIADDFDTPVDSPEHALIRSTAWMGGDLVEGRYLLGILTGTNLFRMSHVQRMSELTAMRRVRMADLKHAHDEESDSRNQ
ncbi:MAG: hypothetical protein ACREHD_24660 [Pirellulales bacterium]